MPFRARYATGCANCKQEIKQGELITWSRVDGKSAIRHASCSISASVTILDEAGLIKEEVMTSIMVKKDSNDGLGGFVDLLMPHIEEKQKSTILQVAENVIKEHLKELPTPKVIEVKQENKKVIKLENVHQKFETLLYIISKNHNVYLYGLPGSGKSTAASQVSQALGREFGYISLNPQTPDSKLLGYMDASGTYRGTVFRKLYEHGGVMCIDELDNSSASLLTTLNSGLENGHMAFPDKIVPRHKEFCLVTTGNTNGHGANPMFPERRPFDTAFLERFTYINWEYDENLEKTITLTINPNAKEWLKWVVKARKYCSENHPKVLVSPRASFKGAEYLKDNKLTKEEILNMIVFKGVTESVKKDILAKVGNP